MKSGYKTSEFIMTATSLVMISWMAFAGMDGMACMAVAVSSGMYQLRSLSKKGGSK